MERVRQRNMELSASIDQGKENSEYSMLNCSGGESYIIFMAHYG